MLEAEVLIGAFVRKQHAVVECVLAAQVMSQDNVRQLMRQHCRQAGFVGQHIDHAPADHNRVAHAERFQRRRKQNTRADRPRQLDIVGDLQVVDDRLKNFVEFAIGRQQSGALQALENVVFCLLLPFALRGQRRRILRGGRIVLHAIHPDVCQLVVRGTHLQVVSPQAGLRLECDLVLCAGSKVTFFAVDIGRYPISRYQVQPPAIHVEVVAVARRVSIGSVQADDVEVLIFYPDAAQEAASSGVFFRCYVKYQRADVARELAPDVAEIIVRPVEIVAVGVNHPGKAEWRVLKLEHLGEAAEHAFFHALVLLFQIVVPVDRVAQIHAAQEVTVVARHGAELRILGQILYIGLDHGRARGHHLDQALLALDDAVNHLIHGGGGSHCGRRRRSRGDRGSCRGC